MSNEIFDRETKLDLLVNVIPLFIMAFFIVGFVVFAPFGIDPLASSIQFGLIAIPFVLLSVLTYFAAVAVAGSENNGPVYLPGQAGVSGAEPLEVPGDEGEESASDGTDPAAELDGDDADADTDSDDENGVEGDTEGSDDSSAEEDGTDGDASSDDSETPQND